MWNMRRRLALEALPARQTVLHFAYAGFPASSRGPRRFWMVLERSGVDLCLSDPGFDVDLYIEADIGAMARVWLGDLPFAEAVREKKIRLTGPAPLARQFPHWLLLSPFAVVPRPALTG
jgi:hypothetical protein